MTPPYQNRSTLTPSAELELWCRRMDYAETLPMWHKSPINTHRKLEFLSGADMVYLRWIERGSDLTQDSVL